MPYNCCSFFEYPFPSFLGVSNGFFYLPNFLNTIDFFFLIVLTFLLYDFSMLKHISYVSQRSLFQSPSSSAWIWAACSMQLSSWAFPSLLFWIGYCTLPSWTAAFEKSALILTPNVNFFQDLFIPGCLKVHNNPFWRKSSCMEICVLQL